MTSNRMSILDPSLGKELLYAVYYVIEDPGVLDVVVQRLRHTYLVSMSIPGKCDVVGVWRIGSARSYIRTFQGRGPEVSRKIDIS